MLDIYDIKTFFFGIIFSFKHIFIILIAFFIVFFYILLYYYLKLKSKFYIKTEDIADNTIKSRFEYLIKNIDSLPREIFYRELGLFIKLLISKEFNNNKVFFMTLSEIKVNFNNIYNDILHEVYYIEFNSNLEDNSLIRQKILQKIQI